MNDPNPPEKYAIIKWDMIFNILLLTGYTYANGWWILAIIAFLQVFFWSYLVFHYRHNRPAYIILMLSIVPFLVYLFYEGEVLKEIAFATTIALVLYGNFWFYLAYKNRKKFEKACQPLPCPVCGVKSRMMVRHLNSFMCESCFQKKGFEIASYYGQKLFGWDADALRSFENQVGTQIPCLNGHCDPSMDTQFDTLFGYLSENKQVIGIFINNSSLSTIPIEISVLNHLRYLSCRGDTITSMEGWMKDLYSLKYLDLRNNPVQFLGDGSYALHVLKKRQCRILI